MQSVYQVLCFDCKCLESKVDVVVFLRHEEVHCDHYQGNKRTQKRQALVDPWQDIQVCGGREPNASGRHSQNRQHIKHPFYYDRSKSR